MLIIAGGGIDAVAFAFIISMLAAIGSVYKDYRDYEGDKLGRTTLFTKYGLKRGKKIYILVGTLFIAVGYAVSLAYGFYVLAFGQIVMYFVVKKSLEARDRARAYRIIIALFIALLIVSVVIR